MKMRTFVSVVIVAGCHALPCRGLAQQGGAQPAPELSLAHAAQIAEQKISDAKLPPDNFLRSMELRYLPGGEKCYYAYFQPPVLRGWVDGAQPKAEEVTVQYLRINMDGSSSFEKRTVNMAAH